MKMLHRLILTLIIQNNAAIRKVQRLQDIVTYARTHGGIGDSRRLDISSTNVLHVYIDIYKMALEE